VNGHAVYVHFSIIAANSTIDSSDSLFALSNRWSDNNIITI
jgi:hypothetical protein